MASSIISTTIDETFPVAGQDNDSQGFRDNFAIIKDNFAYAKTEIETLQNDTAKTNVDNSFNNNTLSVVNLEQHTQTAYDATSGISTSTNVSFTQGHHFAIVAQADVTLTITDWPDTDQYAEMRFQIRGDGASARDVTFAGAGTIYTDGNAAFGGGATLTLDIVTTEWQVVKAWTFNGGVSVFLEFIGTFNEV